MAFLPSYTSSSNTNRSVGSKKKKSFFTKVIDVVSTPGNVLSEGAKYLMEEATGKDFYQDGSFIRSLKAGGSEGWGDSLRRVGVGRGAGFAGIVLDIALDPLTYLGGAGALSKIGKVGKVAKGGVGLTGTVNQGIGLVNDLVKTQGLLKSAKGASEVAKLTNKIGTIESSLKGVADILQSSGTLKVKNFVSKANLAGSIATAGKGIEEFLNGNSSESRLTGALLMGLGGLGIKGNLVDAKTIQKVASISKNRESFSKNLTKLVMGGADMKASELAVLSGQRVAQNVGIRRSDMYDIAAKLGIDSPDHPISRAISRHVEYGEKLPKEMLENKSISRLIEHAKVIRDMETDIRKSSGKSVIDDDTYLRTVLWKKYSDGRVEKADDVKDAVNRDLLMKMSNTKRNLKTVGKFKTDENSLRKYDTDTRNKVLAERKFNDDKGEFVFYSPSDVIGSTDAIAKSLIKYSKDTVPGKKLAELADSPMQADIQRAWNPEQLSKTKETLRESLISKIVKAKSTTKETLREVSEGLNNQKKLIKSSVDAIVNRSDDNIASAEDLKVALDKEKDQLRAFFDSVSTGLNKKQKAEIDNAFADYNNAWQREMDKIGQKSAKLIADGFAPLPYTLGIKGTSGIYTTKDVSKGLSNVYGKTEEDLLSKVGQIVRNVKLGKVTGDLFQYSQGARSGLSLALSVGGKNALKRMFGFKPIIERLDDVDTMGKYGVNISLADDQASRAVRDVFNPLDPDSMGGIDKFFFDVRKKLENNPLTGRLTKLLEKNEQFAYNHFMPNLKINGFKMLHEKLIKQGMDVDAAGYEAAKIVNNMFAGKNWEQIMAANPNISKRVMDFARISLFAPDYLASNLGKTFGAGKVGAVGEAYKKNLVISTFLALTATELGNFALTGHSTLQNTAGNELSIEIPKIKDAKGNPLAVSVIGNWGEPLRFLMNPLKFITGKQGGALKAFTDLKSGQTSPLGVAFENLAPIPISASTIIDWGVKNKLEGQEKTGVPNGFIDAITQMALETLGVQGAYRSGKSTDNLIQQIINNK